jgi:hypothetical protein
MAQVILVARRMLKRREFDVDPMFFGTKGLSTFKVCHLSGNIQCAFGEHSVHNQGTFSAQSGNVQWCMLKRREFYVNPVFFGTKGLSSFKVYMLRMILAYLSASRVFVTWHWSVC